ncbi:MAG: hypothetical protein P4L61_03200 [Candidatus Pacebacteria bacterium]|nr:hypothetical protein [Candidatus Paceibacterota bacterium]
MPEESNRDKTIRLLFQKMRTAIAGTLEEEPLPALSGQFDHIQPASPDEVRRGRMSLPPSDRD